MTDLECTMNIVFTAKSEMMGTTIQKLNILPILENMFDCWDNVPLFQICMKIPFVSP